MKTLVALTPITGAVVLPLLVCLLMVNVSIAAGVLAAVAISSVWFVAMLRTSELPEHG
jgi:MFS superfamily sulfate permease-like transporter